MTKVDRLQLVTAFLAVADAGNLSLAARRLGITQPTASRHLRELEKLLGMRLASRSTRNFHLTGEGEQLRRQATGWADVWTEWEETLKTGAGIPPGQLRLIGPLGYGQGILIDAVALFRSAHPQVEVELRLTDRPVDLISEGADCWVRVGGVPNDQYHVRRIGRMRRVLIAASDFRAAVADPEDLASYPFVGLMPYVAGRLLLISASGQRREVAVPTPVSTDSLLASYRAIQVGLGIGASAPWMCSGDLAAGRVRRVLPDWELEPILIEVAALAGRFRPARINAFIDILHEVMRSREGFESAS
jgi:DNA-binding transcriptional LysR family regulator